MSCDHDWQDTSLHNAENGLPIVRCAKCDLERDDGQDAAQAIELAYGLLWRCGCDRRTGDGERIYQARQSLLAQFDRDGQARDIDAAQALWRQLESRKNSRTILGKRATAFDYRRNSGA